MRKELARRGRPKRYLAFLAQANGHLAAGEVGPARLLVQEGLGHWPEAGQLHLLNAKLLEAEGQEDRAAAALRDAVAALRREVELFPKSPDLGLALAEALVRCGETDAAADALAIARQRGAGEDVAAPIELRVTRARRDWPAMRSVAQRLISQHASPTAHDFLALAIACRNLNDLDAAADAAARACECDPAHVESILTAALIAQDRGDADAALAHYRGLARHAPANSRWACEIVRLLVVVGRVRAAASELDAALARMPTDPLLWGIAVDAGFRTLEQAKSAGLNDVGHGLYARLRQRAPADSELLRPVAVDDKLSDIIVAPAVDAHTAVLVFTTTNDTFSMPLPIFDRYLAALGVTAIYLKDFERLLYMKGVRSLGSSYDATLAALRQMVSRLGVRHLCTIGDSDGGFAAIRYGVSLGADRILDFAGPTHWRPELDAYPMMMKHLAANLSANDMDLKAFLANRKYASKIALFYGEECLRDKTHATYLGDADGVTLRSIKGLNEHDVLRWLALNADLRGILRGMLAP